MKTREPYQIHDDEFIRETINLIETSNKSVTEIGRDIGVKPSTLYGWQKRKSELETKGRELPIGTLNHAEEIRRLRRELEDAKMERDILKKAVAVFSKHQR